MRPPRLRCTLFPLIYPPHLLGSYKRQLYGFVLFSRLTKQNLASYVISVRRTKSLLTASFRFYLTIDTLAVQLYTSLSPRRVRDFHPLERAHGAQTKISPAIAWLTIQKFIIFYCPLDGEHTIIIVVYFFIPMQQTCKMSDVFLQVLFHSSVYLIFRLLLKNRIMIILMANSNHTCLLVSRRTPVSGINCVFSFVIFNSITWIKAITWHFI